MENVARVRYRIQKTSSKIEYHRGRDIDAIKRNLSGDRLRTFQRTFPVLLRPRTKRETGLACTRVVDQIPSEQGGIP